MRSRGLLGCLCETSIGRRARRWLLGRLRKIKRDGRAHRRLLGCLCEMAPQAEEEEEKSEHGDNLEGGGNVE